MLHIGRNILSLIFSRVLAAVILFLVYTRLAQYLGPEQAGQYGLLAGLLMVFSMFVDLGMSQLVIKKVSEDRSAASRYLSNYFAVQAGLAAAFMLIMAAFVYFGDYPPLVEKSLYVTAVVLFLSSLSLPFRSIINAFQRLTIIAKVNFGNSMINALFMILAIVFRQNIFFLAFIGVAVSLFDLVIYGYITHRKITPFRLQLDRPFIRQLFIWTWPFTLLTFFSIYNRIDTLMLPHLRSFEETGYYAVAYKFWDVLAFLPSVIGISLYPFFAERLGRGAIADVKTGIETYTRYMIALALPLAVGAYLVAENLVTVFYGPEFQPASQALWLLVAGVAILLIYSPANSLVISQQTKAATKITGFTLLFNFVTNLILIPKFGFVAAAATTVASELIQASCYAYIIKTRIVNYRLFGNFLKPLVAVVVMAGAVILLQNYVNIWLTVILAGVVYGLALVSLRFFQKADWELFLAAVNFRTI